MPWHNCNILHGTEIQECRPSIEQNRSSFQSWGGGGGWSKCKRWICPLFQALPIETEMVLYKLQYKDIFSYSRVLTTLWQSHTTSFSQLNSQYMYISHWKWFKNTHFTRRKDLQQGRKCMHRQGYTATEARAMKAVLWLHKRVLDKPLPFSSGS